MDDALRQLYHDMVLHHGSHPQGRGTLAPPCAESEGFNPLCGDRILVQLRTDKDRIQEVKFDGSGCTISVASASLMTEAVRGLSLSEVQNLFSAFTALCRGEEESESQSASNGASGGASNGASAPPPALGPEHESLAVFAGVRAFPMRVKCATLAWHTLQAALEGRAQATTE